MIIKSFVGASVAEALKLIRSELGPRAVVLKTRSLGAGESGAGKRMVEITACLERPTVGALQESMSGPTPQGFERLTRIKKLAEPEHETPNRPEAVNAAAGPGLEPPGVNLNDTEEFARRLEEKLDLILDAQVRPSGLEDYPAEVVELAGMLLEHDIPERLLRPLVKRINGRLKASDGDVGGKTSREFAEEIMVEEFARRCLPDFALKAGDLAVFIGPSGSGKTSALGKLAVDLIFKKKLRTELSTLDDFRVAAREEIAGYSEALGAKLIDPQETSDRSRVTEHDIAPVTLVDCHSNIYDQTRYMELVKQVTALRPAVTFLTISALTRSSDLSRILKRFKPLNPTHLIVTHTDLTEAVGGVYTTLVDLDLQLAALTNAPGSLGEILTPDPGSMAHRIFRRSQ